MAEVGLGLNIISFTKPTAEILPDIDSVIARLTESRVLIAAKLVQMRQSGADALGEVITAIEERLTT